MVIYTTDAIHRYQDKHSMSLRIMKKHSVKYRHRHWHRHYRYQIAIDSSLFGLDKSYWSAGGSVVVISGQKWRSVTSSEQLSSWFDSYGVETCIPTFLCRSGKYGILCCVLLFVCNLCFVASSHCLNDPHNWPLGDITVTALTEI